MVRHFTLLFFLSLTAAAQTSTPQGSINITLWRVGSGMDLSLPAYKIAIDGSGAVSYEGKGGVHAIGVRKSRIQPSAVRQLAQKMVDKGYFDFPTSYGSCSDGGMVKTSLEINGRRKMISEGCNAGPDALHQLEDEIDKVTNSQVWVRGRVRLLLHWPWWHS
jgi:hypothetical protein